MRDPALTKLRTAAKGLVYVSERDAPWRAFGWEPAGKLDAAAIRKLGGHDADEPVKAVPFDTFFGGLTKAEDWHSDEENAQVEKYRALVEAVRAELTDPKVFRVGETDVAYYVVGTSAKGNWVGVTTKATET
jgi:hypothetical protein